MTACYLKPTFAHRNMKKLVQRQEQCVPSHYKQQNFASFQQAGSQRKPKLWLVNRWILVKIYRAYKHSAPIRREAIKSILMCFVKEAQTLPWKESQSFCCQDLKPGRTRALSIKASSYFQGSLHLCLYFYLCFPKNHIVQIRYFEQ